MVLKNKKIVITGGTGHLGKKLIEKLGPLKPKIFVLSRNEIKNAGSTVSYLKCDISSIEGLKKFKEYFVDADFLVHLAAHIPGGDYKKKYLESVNVIGTKNIAMLAGNRCAIINASTCEVYGRTDYIPIDELHPCNPYSDYGASKLKGEEILQKECKKKGNKLVILRFATIYGPGENIPRAIPNFIDAVLKNQNPEIFGDGMERRDYIYIDDAAQAIVNSMLRPKAGIYNVSSGKGIPVLEIAGKIISLSNKPLKPIFTERKKEKNDYVFDITKAKKYLGFRPRTSLATGLRNEIIHRTLKNSKTVYIDFDGTLMDVSERLWKIHEDSIISFGLKPLEKSAYIKLKREGMKEFDIMNEKYDAKIFQDYEKLRISKIEDEAYLKYDKTHKNIKKTLSELSKERKLILITNRKAMNLLENEMKRNSIYGFFSGIQIGRDGIKDKNSIIIGDSEDDVAASKKFNLNLILVGNGTRSAKFLSRYRHGLIVKSFSLLSEFF